MLNSKEDWILIHNFHLLKMCLLKINYTVNILSPPLPTPPLPLPIPFPLPFPIIPSPPLHPPYNFKKLIKNHSRSPPLHLHIPYSTPSPLLPFVPTPFSPPILTTPITLSVDESQKLWMLDVFYRSIVYSLVTASVSTVPRVRHNFYKFWWDEELTLLKDNSMKTSAVDQFRKTSFWWSLS